VFVLFKQSAKPLCRPHLEMYVDNTVDNSVISVPNSVYKI